jgi:hypothetical protein
MSGFLFRARTDAGTKLRTYDRPVGARTLRRRDDSARKKQEPLTLWTIIVALAFPMLLAVALVAMDMRSDLSELKSTGQVDDEGAGRVRMIGYMTDGYQPSRDGAMVDMFVLLPEAGQFLHSAHSIPNRMVFHHRDLVWASGILSQTQSTHGDDRAAYAMIAAEVNPATERDIGKWFHP